MWAPLLGAVTFWLMDCWPERILSALLSKEYAMLLVDAPPHVEAWACKRNVVATLALFDGVLTTTLCEEMMIFKSASQNAPLFPQALTRKM
jgi:hypothetical protein